MNGNRTGQSYVSLTSSSLCITATETSTFSEFHISEILKLFLKYVSYCLVLSHVLLFETPWTVAHQTPLSMRFSRQEYWSGLPFSSLEDLFDPRIEPRSPALQANSLPSEPPRKPKNTGVDSPSIIQGNFPTQGSEPGSPALQADSLPAEPRGKHRCCSYFPSNTRGTCCSLRQIKLD